jgi:aspartate aminotransferase-like enzyme
MSYLNLRRYLKYGQKNQTPSTAPTQLFKHFNLVLENFDIEKLKQKIKTNSSLLLEAIGINNIVGDTEGPVITIHKDNIPIEIANKYQLYGINTDSEYYQIFTYSCDDKLYIKFCKELIK